MNQLHFHHWDLAQPTGVILVIHGLGEYTDRYDWAARQWQDAGFAVIAVDLPGHGRSYGKRGHITNFHEFLDAIDETVKRAKACYPAVPIVLFGHSMGGLAVVRYVQSRNLSEQIRLIMLSSPCLEFAFHVPPMQERLLRFMSRIWPSFLQSTNIKPTDVTRSTEIQAFYATDSLVLHKVSVRLLSEFVDHMGASRNTSTRLTIPILVCQAGQDRLAHPAASESFVSSLDCHDKLFKMYVDCHHELLNEPERVEIHKDMTNWIQERIAP